jgi:hypothetical protein
MPSTKRPGPTKGPAPNSKGTGTLPRAKMPAPSPPKPAPPAPAPAASEEEASKAVLHFATEKIKAQVGSGECYDLADEALKGAGAKSAPDHGTITASADYVWGREVPLSEAKPGDVIQFRDYKYDKRDEIKESGEWKTQEAQRRHHTAVVESVDDQGVAVVIEQNVGDKGDANRKKVRRTTLPLKSATVETKVTKSSVTVTGTVKVYRAVPKPPQK